MAPKVSRKEKLEVMADEIIEKKDKLKVVPIIFAGIAVVILCGICSVVGIIGYFMYTSTL